MKNVLLLLTLSFFVSCVSTKNTTVSSPAPMSSEVVTTDDKDTNYIKANEWMVENFNDAKSVIQFSDKEAGIIKGKYLMKAGYYQAAAPYVPEIKTDDFYAIITLRVKDNKSRIEIALTKDNYVITEYNGKPLQPTPEELKVKGNQLMDSFSQHMRGQSANTW